MNAAVWLNDTRIGDGGSFAPRLANDLSHPLLLAIPPGLLRAGENRIDVDLALAPTYPGVLGPLLIGPRTDLEPAFAWRTFWQVTLVQLSILLNVYLAAVGLLLRRRRRLLAGVAWSSLASLLWAVAMLETALPEPPLPTRLWQWLTVAALAGSVTAFVVGAHRFLALGRPRSERGVVLVWVAGALAWGLALADGRPALVESVVITWALATAGVAAYLVRLLFRLRDRLPASSLRMAAPLGVVGLAFGVHDVALGAGLAVPFQVALLPYLGSLIALWGVWRVIELLIDSLSASEQLNRDLDRRVAERGEEIARSYERVRQLEREQLLQAERERLMRDIHDGLGAQLTSTLAAVESADTPRDEIEDALRDTLDDMRLLVASLSPGNDDLVALLARWRGRIQRRLERRGLAFDWRVVDLPRLPWLGPREATSALRIFQEAVSNVLQHAGAATISVATGCADDERGRPGVFVEIRDDGRGFGGAPPGDRSPGVGDASGGGGFGLRNMARRTAELGGRITVAPAAPGTRVHLWLPLVRDAGSRWPDFGERPRKLIRGTRRRSCRPACSSRKAPRARRPAAIALSSSGSARRSARPRGAGGSSACRW